MAEEKKMIKRARHIKDMIICHTKELTDLKYEARRKVRRKNFEIRETEFLKVLKTPLKFLKAESVKTEAVGGEKVKVRRTGQEEVLPKSGIIISWQQDLLHLQNQLTEEQPGSCQGFDKRQKLRDERVLKTKEKEERHRAEELKRYEANQKVCLKFKMRLRRKTMMMMSYVRRKKESDKSEGEETECDGPHFWYSLQTEPKCQEEGHDGGLLHAATPLASPSQPPTYLSLVPGDTATRYRNLGQRCQEDLGS